MSAEDLSARDGVLILEPAGGPPSTGGRRLTLRQLGQGWLRWLAAHNHPATTIASYGDGLGRFLQYADRYRVQYAEEVTVLLLDGFFMWLREHGAAAAVTVAHRRSVLVSFWRWLEHEGFADRNMAAKTYPIKTPKRVPVWLEPGRIDAFLATLALRRDLMGQRDHAIVATFFYAGVRVGELVMLRLEDIDVPGARIRVREGKGGKGRVLYMAPKLQPVLRAYLEYVRPALVTRPIEQVSPFLFVRSGVCGGHFRSKAGQPLLTRSIYTVIFRRAQEVLGHRLTPHSLRHTCASYLLYHGAQPETVQRLLGHADIRTTMGIYVHVPQKRQEEELARIFGLDGQDGLPSILEPADPEPPSLNSPTPPESAVEPSSHPFDPAVRAKLREMREMRRRRRRR